jgi:CRISPR-associated protein (TIGR03986 family)
MAKKKTGKGKAPKKFPQEKTSSKSIKSSNKSGYRFLNPYNFVRFLGKGKDKPDDPGVTLLGRCMPPPHDRYVGITGKITCTIETVTPLFISDSEGISEDPNNHKTYRFFQINDQYTIPATALRGMIRSVFEAVTNSCFSILGDVQLDYRIPADQAPSLQPAVITKLPNAEKKEMGEIQLLKFAWIHRSVIETAAKSVLSGHLRDAPWSKESPFNSYFDKVLKDQSLPIQAEVRQNVRNRNVDFGGKSYPFPFNEVTKILNVGISGSPLSKPSGNQFWGYLKITGPNVIVDQVRNGKTIHELRKHDERFFYWDGSSISKASIPYQDVVNRENAYERYNGVRVAQKNPAHQQLPYETYLQNETLSVGDLVWVSAEAGIVNHIGSVSIPKLRYRYGVKDLLPSHLHTCSRYEDLCIACRVFGWVHPSSPKDPNIQIAYAGRVSFSHGILQGEPKKLNETITLAILSSPKPTTTSFYLIDANNQPSFNVHYDTSNAKLRGRKFYRHQGKITPQEYKRTTKDKQNRTVKDVLDKDNQFKFTVCFENLAPVELGALLWTLEMDGKGFHRLGFAKPLGFGSVRIKIDEVKVLDPKKRYTSLNEEGWQIIQNLNDWKKAYLDKFKGALENRYGNTKFESLPNVEDLQSLLQDPPNNLPIHYPRPPYYGEPTGDSTKPNPEGKQFEWFMGNKKAKAKHTLPLAPDDTNGFPLITKDGKEG